MKKILIGCGALLAILIVLGLILFAIGAGGYNHLVSLSQSADAQWAQVQNVYQRRADLIPNLVQTVAGAANFEKSTLTEVTDARASVGRVVIDAKNAPTDAAQLAEFEKAQGQLSNALSRLLMVSEQYPDLKANANFRDLQAQLEGTENRISVERGRFNDVVRDYDTAIHSFPALIYAGMYGFKDNPYFSATAGSDVPPKVQFDFSGKASGGSPASTQP